MNGAQEIVFGHSANQVSHAFRHTDTLGLDRTDVMEAIRRDLQPFLPLPMPPPSDFIFVGKVTVGGIELHYRAYPVNEGLVNVGRIIGI